MFRTILLPYPNFRRSVACYSDPVLYQTLRLILSSRRCLSKDQYDIVWHQRELWISWSQWKQAYIRLGMMCAEEAKARDIPYNKDEAASLFRGKRGQHWAKPLWINWEPLHSQHRESLLHAGEVERVGRRIINWKGLGTAPVAIQTDCVNEWFMTDFTSSIYEGDASTINEAHDLLDTLGAPRYYSPNHYEQFNWSEQPNGCIEIWPPDPELPWICRA